MNRHHHVGDEAQSVLQDGVGQVSSVNACWKAGTTHLYSPSRYFGDESSLTLGGCDEHSIMARSKAWGHAKSYHGKSAGVTLKDLIRVQSVPDWATSLGPTILFRQSSSLIREPITAEQLREGSQNKDPTIRNQDSQERVSKKAKVHDGAMLHRICCKAGVTVKEVDHLLRLDPCAASRSEVVYKSQSLYSHMFGRAETKLIKEPYKYPLNLAIKNQATPEVLCTLIEAAPSVLTMKDGFAEEGSLSILIKYLPHDVTTLDKMLLTKAACVMLTDRHRNTAAHIAATHGASPSVMRHILIMHPESVRMCNFHGKTPLELAQQHIQQCSEEVAIMLLDQTPDLFGFSRS